MPHGLTPSVTVAVVILFADDFGWGDLPCYGHPTQVITIGRRVI
jgi:arylsulfatase A-like enzyme